MPRIIFNLAVINPLCTYHTSSNFETEAKLQGNTTQELPMGNHLGERVEGTVVEYNRDGGYGFIQTMDLPDSVSKEEDVFFHISDVNTRATPSRGWRFEFSVSNTDKGYRAENLVKIGETEAGNVEESTHTPGFDYEVEESANVRRLEQIEQKHQEEEDDEDDDASRKKTPFDDDVRGSMNDLL